MGPDWKGFVDELISGFDQNPTGEWTGQQIVRFIKDCQIQYLERVLKCMDKDDKKEDR